jgi:hypothetical protein
MKRFTETNKWGDLWYRKLEPAQKLLWQWLLDNCDHAGVVEPDLELASFQIGIPYHADAMEKLGDRVKKISPSKWLIPKFIDFQYGHLSEDCKAHGPVFASLKKHQIEGYTKAMDSLKDKDKEKDKDKTEHGQQPALPVVSEDGFDRFWATYPNKMGKLDARKSYERAIKKTSIDAILKAIDHQKKLPQWTKDSGRFIPHPATWLNQGRWMDEGAPQISAPQQSSGRVGGRF